MHIPYPRTCSQLVSVSGHSTSHSGYYNIDPDGPGGSLSPFPVYCDFSHSSRLSVVHHASEEFVVVDGHENKGSFVINITYLNNVTTHQMRSLIRVSSKCSYAFQFTCFAVVLSESGWWTSYNGSAIKDWSSTTDFCKNGTNILIKIL